MKRFASLIITIVLSLLQLQAATIQNDMLIIEQRMFNNFKNGVPSNKEVKQLIESITDAGAFKGIDYLNEEFNSGDKKRKHLTNTHKLAKAYVCSHSENFQNPELYKAIESLLVFWIDKDLDDANWWHRSIGFPKDLMPTVVLMKKTLEEKNPKLLAKLLDYLDYSWDNTSPRLMKGANGTDISKITFTQAVLSRNEKYIKEVMDFAGSLVYLAEGGTQEGIYPDYSFSQHSEFGRQLYLGTYGREYIDGVLFFMEFTNATHFALEAQKTNYIENLFLHGVAWMWYKNELDANQCGRKIVDKTNFAPSFVALTRRLIALDTPQTDKLELMLKTMLGEEQLIGNKAYPYHDYMIHRGDSYMTTIRMTSTRTVGNEAGNGQGFENYHTGDGATYFKVFGDEYSPIYSKWNWKFIPGTTVVADTKPMPIPMWGKGGNGGNDYAAVVSDGKCGAAGFIFQKDSLTAHKAWFNFENATVALGAGITTVRTDAPVITTVNQTSLKKDYQVFDPRTIWHNSIGYKSLMEQDFEISKDEKNAIFRLSINHSISPTEQNYAYAVYPAISKSEFKNIDLGVDILSNNSSIQAVREKSSGKIFAIFYQPSVLAVNKKISVQVTLPCALICTPMAGDEYEVRVANPYCETKSIENIVVTMKNKKKDITVKLL